MKGRHIALQGLAALSRAGAHKASCSVSSSEQHELTADAGRLSLLRTTFQSSVGMMAIRDQRRGASGTNKTTPEALESLASDTLGIARASQPDEAYDIAEHQPSGVFSLGPEDADRSAMLARLSQFLETCRLRYPAAIIEQAILQFTRTVTHVVNTNGVDFAVTKGLYGFHVMFTSKDGHKTSSFNGTSCVTRDLDRELITCGSVDRLLRESVEQTDPQGLSGRFVGDLILTPDVFADFLGLYLDTFLRDSALIAGTSWLKDKLDQQVSAPCITVHDLPRSAELASNHFLTPDGFLAQDHTIIDRGTLKTYLLSLYGARKTGLARALNVGTSCIVEAGDRGIDDIVDGVERGIILGRFSGGNPGESGDVSGVAKNSYYVEDGQVRYPVTETMISSNLLDLFANAGAVSSERVDFGSTILPWVRCTGVTISGK